MGRAMLIIIAGVLFAMGFVAINTGNQGRALTERIVNYAEFTMGKNAAHTAIQMAMQEINQDPDFPDKHNSADNAWVVEIQGIEVRLHTHIIPSGDYWNPDMLWLYSRAQMGEEFGNVTVEVKSHYLKQPFSSLVPDFSAALTVPANPDQFSFSIGGAAKIKGNAPDDSGCTDSKPGITTTADGEKNFDSVSGSSSIEGDPKIAVDNDLSYQPTDEMIARLYETIGQPDGAKKLSTKGTGPLSGSNVDMGSPENPGVFFVEDELKVTGGKIEGYGILIIRTNADMALTDEDGNIIYDEDGAQLELAGNFEFNGLVVFENAYNFKARGTPAINGSVLVGTTDDYPLGEKLEIDMSGNFTMQYDCRGEDYAKMAAAEAVKQNKYTRVVSTENYRYPGTESETSAEDDASLLEKIKGVFN